MIRKLYTGVLLSLVSLLSSNAHMLGEDKIGEILPTLILKPLEGKTGDPGAIIFFQGA